MVKILYGVVVNRTKSVISIVLQRNRAMWCWCVAIYKSKYSGHLRNRIKDTIKLVFWCISFGTMAIAFFAVFFSGATKMTEAQVADFTAYLNNKALVVLFWMALSILVLGVTYSFVDAFVRWIKGMKVPPTTDIETRVSNLESAVININNSIHGIERTINKIANENRDNNLT